MKIKIKIRIYCFSQLPLFTRSKYFLSTFFCVKMLKKVSLTCLRFTFVFFCVCVCSFFFFLITSISFFLVISSCFFFLFSSSLLLCFLFSVTFPCKQSYAGNPVEGDG